MSIAKRILTKLAVFVCMAVMLVTFVPVDAAEAATRGEGRDLLYYEIGLNQKARKDVPSVVTFDVANSGKVHIVLTFPVDFSDGAKYKLFRDTGKKIVLTKSGTISQEDTTIDEHGKHLYTVDWDLPIGYLKQDIGSYALELTFSKDTKFSYDIGSYQIKLGRNWRIAKGTRAKVNAGNYDGKVQWKTSDKKIAVISRNGTLRGKKVGSCYVIAILENGVKVKVPLQVDTNHVSFDPDAGGLTWY